MCSRWPLPGRDLTVDEWNASALESPKKRTQQHWIFIYCFFFFFLLCHKHGEPRDSTREDPIVLPTERRLIFLCCLRAGQAELHKQSQAKFRRQSVSVRTIRLQLFPLFVYIHLNSCGAVVAHSTVTCMKPKLSGSDLLKVLAHTLNEIFWKAAVEKVKRSQKALYLNQEESMRAESYLIECFFHIYNTLQTKQNKTQKKSKLCFLLGRLWSLLSPVCEDRTATLAG